MKRAAILGFVMVAAGCTPTVPPLSADQAAGAATERLCWGYGQYGGIETGAADQSRAAIRAELDKRGAISAQEWAMIDGGALNKGMRRCAVLAALGKPVIDDRDRDGAEVLGFHNSMFVSLRDGTLVEYGRYGIENR